MIYLLYGEDTYRSWQKLLSIKQKYTDTSMGDTDLIQLDGAELTAAQFAQQTQTLPFLAKHRLVIIKNLLTTGKKEVIDGVMELLPAVPSTTVLFFYESGQPDKRLKLFQTLNKPKQAQHFELLVGPALSAEIKAQATQRGLVLTASQVQRLVTVIGADGWRLSHELEKLGHYYQAEAGSALAVADEVLDLLVQGEGEVKIFDLTDALGNRQSARAVKLIEQLSGDENGLGLLAMIAGHYRNLLLIADGQRQQLPRPTLMKQLAMHPFAFDKAFAQARQYSYEELISIYRYLLHLDLSAKQSIIDPLVGLTVLAANLTERPLQLPDLTEEAMIY